MTVHVEQPTYSANDKPMSVGDCATWLGVSKDTVRKLMAEGMPSMKLGYRTVRFDKTDVQRFLYERSVKASQTCGDSANHPARFLPQAAGAPSPTAPAANLSSEHHG